MLVRFFFLLFGFVTCVHFYFCHIRVLHNIRVVFWVVYGSDIHVFTSAFFSFSFSSSLFASPLLSVGAYALSRFSVRCMYLYSSGHTASTSTAKKPPPQAPRKPPKPPQKPAAFTLHDQRWEDPYSWMSNLNDKVAMHHMDVYMVQEDKYTEVVLSDTDRL